MRKADILSALVLIGAGLAALLVVIPAQTTRANTFGLPPDFFPNLAVMAIVGLAALLLVDRLRRALAAADDQAGIVFSVRRFLFVLAAVALLIVCLGVVHVAGFAVGGAFTVAAFMLFMGERRPLRIAAVAAGAALTVYLVFTQVLHVSLG